MHRLVRLLPRTRPVHTAVPVLARPYSSSPFQTGPAPPRLPAEQQAEFERLQREASVSSAFSADAPTPENAAVSSSEPAPAPAAEAAVAAAAEETKGTDFNSGIFRGAPPEFDGDVNPKTGEVGGPKNEPLRWGGDGDWSYNGRVTDF